MAAMTPVRCSSHILLRETKDPSPLLILCPQRDSRGVVFLQIFERDSLEQKVWKLKTFGLSLFFKKAMEMREDGFRRQFLANTILLY